EGANWESNTSMLVDTAIATQQGMSPWSHIGNGWSSWTLFEEKLEATKSSTWRGNHLTNGSGTESWSRLLMRHPGWKLIPSGPPKKQLP
ncbi:MAG: hypothetical protein RBU25_13295, partial [Lentisphaeria bacterium]|nr:hypothetical protein [Lentisphaeria bacterium]